MIEQVEAFPLIMRAWPKSFSATTAFPLMVRSAAKPCVSNHEAPILQHGAASFETAHCVGLLRMRGKASNRSVISGQVLRSEARSAEPRRTSAVALTCPQPSFEGLAALGRLRMTTGVTP
jgi:hypothetical protein